MTITKPTKIDKWFCVWDGNYGDFINSFNTLEKSKEYCRKAIENNPKYYHHYKIGKWISPDTDDYKLIEEIKTDIKF